MELPNILTSDNFSISLGHNKKGFTLIELLMVMGLFAMILSFGLAIGFDSYRRDILRAERNTVISALQKARSQAVNNINNNKHGFCFEGTNYIVFNGTSSALRIISRDLIIPKNPSIVISGFSDGVVFEQLTGSATPTGDLVLSDGISSTTVSINEEGRINW